MLSEYKLQDWHRGETSSIPTTARKLKLLKMVSDKFLACFSASLIFTVREHGDRHCFSGLILTDKKVLGDEAEVMETLGNGSHVALARVTAKRSGAESPGLSS